MARRSGISLAEIVVVVAILMTLVALVVPSVASARKRAAEATCMANLRQVHIILALYRSEWGSESSVGTPSQMGLPPNILSIKRELQGLASCAGADPLRCTGFGDGPGTTPMWPTSFPYVPDPPRDLQWSTLVSKRGESTIIFHDPNHQLSCPVAEFSIGRSIGLRLDGSVSVRTYPGDPTSVPNWWYEE